jgi:hypothetical protein
MVQFQPFDKDEKRYPKLTILHLTSDALPFDVEGTGFEISRLHKAASLFIRHFLISNPKT